MPKAPSLLSELEALDGALLRRRWHALMRTPAPRGLTRSLMIRILAWREQVNATGDLDRRELRALADTGSARIAAGSHGHRAAGQPLRPGMVLVREHGGIHHRVAVMADGFVWNGRTFGSLSAVARAITGVRWNGHRFFGLDRAPGRSGRGRRNAVDANGGGTNKGDADDGDLSATPSGSGPAGPAP